LSFLSEILGALSDFILPQSCLLCNKEIRRGMICDNCLEYLPVVEPPLCFTCGRPVDRGSSCYHCAKEHVLDHGRAWMLLVPPSDKVIHHFKYRRKTDLAELLGRAMAGIIKADHTLSKADIIMPIPLFWWKRTRRGYNQADLLARTISLETGIAQKNTIKRIKSTRTQTRLSEDKRRKNVLNAFEVGDDTVEDKKVILIDDVLTTGATIQECARVLKQSGAARVYSCVAAITPDKRQSTG